MNFNLKTGLRGLPDHLLLGVEKPARYTGNEWNAIYKPRSADGAALTRFAICFPDVYEVGMSHIGLRILYEIINRRDDAACERAFAPWPDMERLMRNNGIALYGLESRDAIFAFDFIGFTLQYELCYTNVLNMLDLAGLPVKARDRGGDFPVVLAGGPCVCNPAPMSEFIDFFTPGEGEDVVNDILDLYGAMKAAAAPGRADKREFLYEVSKLDGVYAPAFPPANGHKVKKRVVADLSAAAYPERGIVPNIEIVHDRAVLELFRGCIHGCRFCQAGYIYRPVREKDPKALARQAAALACSTGYDEISLTSLSTSDYTGLAAFTEEAAPRLAEQRVNLSLPSLRAGALSPELAQSAGGVRKSGLTFAPEAGTQRLRDAINKGVDEDDLLGSVEAAFNEGWGALKLYFMIGLPTETMEDVEAIAGLVRKVAAAYMKTPKERRARDLSISVGVSSFVPKPFTPFQWEAQDDMATLREKQRHLRDALKMRYVKLNWHGTEESFLEAVFSKGGAETGAVLYAAWKAGAKFDGWSEHFKYDIWLAAFEEAGVDPAGCANRRVALDEPLPWDIMDYGVTKEFLIKEREKAYAGRLTRNCREACANCGVDSAFGCGLRDVVKA